MLAWTAETMLFPTWRNLDESYEGWLYRTGRRPQLDRLQKRGLVTRVEEDGRQWWRLTQLGRLRALGGRDPVAQWNRAWDGKWRLFIFDLPVNQTAARQRLLRWLRLHGFGYLQDSVWIHPDPVDEIAEAMGGFREDVEAFTLMEARHVGGSHPLALVRGAWKFEQIDQAYRQHLKFLETVPRRRRGRLPERAVVSSWLQQEREWWQRAFTFDPLLPRQLWWAGYLGEKAWRARETALRSVVRSMAELSKQS